ncbi:hypothetical protein FE391_43495 [Nonomuraea sp. KC401]|uniref:hypothetical protein n=1 Tax=unclassified Nonomuraea TaxID=2593643 RepID=UPI0010FD069E|nr:MULTISPECIES: hypothetical protein [unclassified Nonomuraea]NBF00225.1 hypothetical protein [Nonomuraea sp. K271]TLF52458.1 hypothetical protein FE391_43495 [Nonomuraea sp. KC401]
MSGLTDAERAQFAAVLQTIRAAGLLADGLGLSEAALPNRYAAHIAADLPQGDLPAAATSSQTGDGR